MGSQHSVLAIATVAVLITVFPSTLKTQSTVRCSDSSIREVDITDKSQILKLDTDSSFIGTCHVDLKVNPTNELLEPWLVTLELISSTNEVICRANNTGLSIEFRLKHNGKTSEHHVNGSKQEAVRVVRGDVLTVRFKSVGGATYLNVSIIADHSCSDVTSMLRRSNICYSLMHPKCLPAEFENSINAALTSNVTSILAVTINNESILSDMKTAAHELMKKGRVKSSERHNQTETPKLLLVIVICNNKELQTDGCVRVPVAGNMGSVRHGHLLALELTASGQLQLLPVSLNQAVDRLTEFVLLGWSVEFDSRIQDCISNIHGKTNKAVTSVCLTRLKTETVDNKRDLQYIKIFFCIICLLALVIMIAISIKYGQEIRKFFSDMLEHYRSSSSTREEENMLTNANSKY